MIEISQDQCTGCGRCAEMCPAGAISIREGHAVVNQTLCRGCQACLSVCPVGAVISVSAPIAIVEPHLPQASSKAVTDVISSRAAPVSWHQRVLPVLADVLSFTGREVLPRLLELLASASPKQPTGQSRPTSGGLRVRQRRRERHGRN